MSGRTGQDVAWVIIPRLQRGAVVRCGLQPAKIERERDDAEGFFDEPLRREIVQRLQKRVRERDRRIAVHYINRARHATKWLLAPLLC